MLWAKPQRHRDTEKAQSPPHPRHNHEDTKTQRKHKARPPTQKRREDLTGFLRVARFQPSDGREPLGRDTAPNTSVHLGVPAQRLALIERKPRHLSFLFSSDGVHASPTPYEGKERQNRRAFGTAAGVKRCDDERSRSRFASFSPAAGDPRSPVGLPPKSENTYQSQPFPHCKGGWLVGLRVFVS